MSVKSLLEDQYEILMELGQGAYASVYKVRHKKHGYIRALKVSMEKVPNEEDRKFRQFVSECRVQLKLGNGCHPNIVRVHQPHLIEDHAVVEMDYIDGCTLVSYMEKKKFIDIDTVYRFIHDVVGAMAYCHYDVYRYLMDINEDGLTLDNNDGSIVLDDVTKERLIKKYQVIHNDLHSNNVMVRYRDGAFVLLDFGLSVQDNKFVKSSARDGGAIEYLSPEKCTDRLDEIVITTMSDVYSLGILLYEVLAGQVPFPCQLDVFTRETAMYKVKEAHRAQTPPAIEPLRRIAFEKVNPGETYEKDYPDWLERMIMKCLEKNPKDRYRNAKDLFDEFNKEMQADDGKSVKALNDEINILYGENSKLKSIVESKNQEINNLYLKVSDLIYAKDNQKDVIQKQEETIQQLKEKITQNSQTKTIREVVVNPTPQPIQRKPKSNWMITAIIGLLAVIGCFIAGYFLVDILEVIIPESEVIIGKSGSKDAVTSLTPQWADDATAEQRRIIGELIESMVMVEGGAFTMGAQKNNRNEANYDKEAWDDECPVHLVTLSDYHIGKYEVTQEQWQAVMGNNPSYYKGNRKPVESVSWNDCQEFVRKLQALTGLKFELPTEAQWEYAARGGNKSRGYKYSGGNDLYSVGWFGYLNTYGDNKGNSGGETHPVGQKMANELGLYDMSGNVWEWCSDSWYSYDSSSVTNPKHDGNSTSCRVLRGGSWDYNAGYCRVSYRLGSDPGSRGSFSGLRLALQF